MSPERQRSRGMDAQRQLVLVLVASTAVVRRIGCRVVPVLRQPADRVAIEYRTDEPGGSYRRMASLAVFLRRQRVAYRDHPAEPGLALPTATACW